MTSRVVYWITREDYPAFRRLFPNNLAFPQSYDVWEQLARKQIAELEAIGDDVRTPIIHPEHFTAYCDASGINYNLASLHAFAAITDRQKREKRT
jgi:hypothetical protein